MNFVPRDLSDRDRDYAAGGAYLRSDPTHRIAGLRLAARAANAGDGVIKMIVGWTDGSEDEDLQNPEPCCVAFYVAVGDQAIDHIGVRPESQMFEELISRDVLQHERFRGFMGGEQVRFETLTFADASACVRHLRDNAISTITPYANLHHNAYLHDKSQQARGIEMAKRAAREIAGLDVDAPAPA